MNEEIINIKDGAAEERKIVNEMISLLMSSEKLMTSEEEKLVSIQLDKLREKMKRINNLVSESVSRISLAKPLRTKREENFLPRELKNPQIKSPPRLKINYDISEMKLDKLERETLKRLREKRMEIVRKKERKPSLYVKFSNKFFSRLSLSLSDKEIFRYLKRDLTKANLEVLPVSYISIMFFTTLISFFIAIFLYVFFLFFNLSSALPIIIPVKENLGLRMLKILWIPFAIPITTLLFMYFYPSLEKTSNGDKIDQELPFATIHMAAISGSMIDPTKIFSIIISTREYPYLEKEFIKLLNEINIYGFDLVSALRNTAFNSPSKRLSELLNGLSTTINSGGDLTEFFDKRSQSLLFEYRLEREKYTRTAETFMDIYISVVIAAPMIFMLLLMMIKISGLGISMTTGTITLIMMIGVAAINVVFLTFLHLKQPS